MRAIQCLSSMPILQGRQMNGTFGVNQKVQLPESVLRTLKLSTQLWKLNNGSIKLYTDTLMKNYLEENNMLDCWDYVDVEVLDTFYKDCTDINFSVFWSAGKFACYLQEKAPFVCIDIDIIVWHHLEFDKYLDFGFAHWEKISENDENYPNMSTIKMPDTFYFRDYNEGRRIYDTHACNMAITYFGNEIFRQEFAELALDFMRGNPVNTKEQYATPEILFIEQRVPLMLACRNSLNYSPVIPCTWSPKDFRIVHPGKYYQNWFFSDLDTSKTFSHLWFHKKYLSENPKENARYCRQLDELYEENKMKASVGKIKKNLRWNTTYVSHKAGERICSETGCSKCVYMVWLKEGDPDITDDIQKYIRGDLHMTYCTKYSRYLGPYQPVYWVGSSEHASI